MKRLLACILALLMMTTVAFAEEADDLDLSFDDLPTMVDLYLGLDAGTGEAWTFVNDAPTVLEVTDDGYIDADEAPADVSISQTQAFRFYGLEEGIAIITFRRSAPGGEPTLTLQYGVMVDSDQNVSIYSVITK